AAQVTAPSANITGAAGTNVGADITGAAGTNVGAGITGTAGTGAGITGGAGASADLGAAGAGADLDAAGGGPLGAAASRHLGASAGVDVRQHGEISREAERGTKEVAFAMSDQRAEAGVYNEVGPTGQAVVRGGAVGMGEAHVDSAMYEHDPARKGEHALHTEQ